MTPHVKSEIAYFTITIEILLYIYIYRLSQEMKQIKYFAMDFNIYSIRLVFRLNYQMVYDKCHWPILNMYIDLCPKDEPLSVVAS